MYLYPSFLTSFFLFYVTLSLCQSFPSFSICPPLSISIICLSGHTLSRRKDVSWLNHVLSLSLSLIRNSVFTSDHKNVFLLWTLFCPQNWRISKKLFSSPILHSFLNQRQYLLKKTWPVFGLFRNKCDFPDWKTPEKNRLPHLEMSPSTLSRRRKFSPHWK